MSAGNINRFTIGVFALILERNKVLLCHRRDVDLWNLPGGGLEVGETPWEGVIRETREETTLNVRVCRLVGIYARPEQDEIALGFLCEIVSGSPQCTDEADSIGYYALGSLPPNTNHEQIEALRLFDTGAHEPVLCVQPGPSPLRLLELIARKGNVWPTI